MLRCGRGNKGGRSSPCLARSNNDKRHYASAGHLLRFKPTEPPKLEAQCPLSGGVALPWEEPQFYTQGQRPKGKHSTASKPEHSRLALNNQITKIHKHRYTV